MAAHSWWRIRSHNCNSSQTGIGEIEMATSPAGADECVGGTAFASGSYGGGYAASSAFDNNTTSNWFQSGGNSYDGAFIGYNFAAPVDIVEVRTGPGSEDNNAMPRIFDIQWSDDSTNGSDGTWTWAWTCYNTSWSAGVKVTFTMPTVQANNQWWGIFCANSPVGNREIVIAEVEFRASLGGADETGSGTASAFVTGGGYSAADMFDNNTGTIFFNGTTGRATMIRYDFGADETILQTAITSSNTGSSNHTRCVSEGYIMYSQDGLAWLRAATLTGLTWGGTETKTFDTDDLGGGGGAVTRRRAVIVT